MGPIAAVFGAALTGLGLFAYFTQTSDKPSPTALIPAFFGLPILILGLLALKDNLRKHAMHLAAMVGLIGLVGALIMAAPKVPTLLSEGKVLRSDGTDATRAIVVQLIMAGICLVFVALCVKSFIDARRARSQAEKIARA